MATNDDVLESKTARIKMGCGNLYCTVSKTPGPDGKLARVGAHVGKNGSCPRLLLTTMCEIVSAVLTAETIDEARVSVLDKIKLVPCRQCPPGPEGTVPTSCLDFIHKRITADDK